MLLLIGAPRRTPLSILLAGIVMMPVLIMAAIGERLYSRSIGEIDGVTAGCIIDI